LDEGRAARLAELEIHVALSLDGTETAHDAARPMRGGAASYRLASRALDLLLATGRPFDVITVVDPATLHELATGVRRILDRGVTSLTLNPSWGAAWSDAALTTMRAQYEEIAALVVAWFRRGRAVAVQPFDSALILHASGRASRSHACGAGVTSFAVGPSGRIYGCVRAVGEDEAARAIGALDVGVDPTRVGSLGAPACPGSCACANLEETGDAAVAGPVQRFHEELVASLAPRIARALEQDELGRATYRTTFVPTDLPTTSASISLEVP
ncbi:MAG TPA: hypothetical protein VL400_13335, partial [Polyangiaceae bacterium]|nr:hypothetical protein [Polyangiaceae bacterium]